jgi:hypothetical protein
MIDKLRQRRHPAPRGGLSNGMLLLFMVGAIVVARLALRFV